MPAIAAEMGQPSLASSAAWRKSSSLMSGTSPTTFSALDATLAPPSNNSNVTVASASSLVATLPSRPYRRRAPCRNSSRAPPRPVPRGLCWAGGLVFPRLPRDGQSVVCAGRRRGHRAGAGHQVAASNGMRRSGNRHNSSLGNRSEDVGRSCSGQHQVSVAARTPVNDLVSAGRGMGKGQIRLLGHCIKRQGGSPCGRPPRSKRQTLSASRCSLRSLATFGAIMTWQ